MSYGLANVSVHLRVHSKLPPLPPPLLVVRSEGAGLYPDIGHGELELPEALLLARYVERHHIGVSDVACVHELSSLALLCSLGIKFFQEVRAR